jgi:SAM-dependent methyltransferase
VASAVAWQQRAEARVASASAPGFRGGELGTPCRYWIDSFLPQRIAGLRRPTPMRVLDVGCHDGLYLEAVRAAGVVGEYVGIDIGASPRWAEHDLGGPLRAEFRVHDAHAVADLTPRGFDLILSITTMEHFEDDKKVLAGVFEQLNPGGRFILIVPSQYSFALLWSHGYRRYDRDETKQHLERVGLDVLEIHDVGGIPSFLLHAAWFNGSQAVVLFGKATLRVMAGFNKARAKRLFGGLDDKLGGTMLYHQRFAAGRAAHSALNRTAARLDEQLPGLPALYAFVAERPAQPR